MKPPAYQQLLGASRAEYMDRFVYALIGAVFGALLGLVCWFLYGLAFSRHMLGPVINASALPWVKALASIFAVLGFLFKDQVGSVLGSTITGIFSAESGRDYGPNPSFWKSVLVLVVIAALLWYVIAH